MAKTFAPLYDVVLCTCCLLKLVNDDTTGCDDTCSPDCHPAGLMGALELAPGEACLVDDEPEYFDNAPCDGCGCRLSGDRVPCTVYGPECSQDDPSNR